MAKKSKKYVEASKQIEKGKLYTKEEAVELVKKVSTSKFDGSIEVAVKLNLDTRKNVWYSLTYCRMNCLSFSPTAISIVFW